jgi:hypothetical protein
MAFPPNQLLLLVANAVSNDLAVVALTDRKGRPCSDTPQRGAWYPLETMVPLGGGLREIVVKAFVAP